MANEQLLSLIREKVAAMNAKGLSEMMKALLKEKSRRSKKKTKAYKAKV